MEYQQKICSDWLENNKSIEELFNKTDKRALINASYSFLAVLQCLPAEKLKEFFNRAFSSLMPTTLEEIVRWSNNILMVAPGYQLVAAVVILEALEKLPEAIRDEVQQAVWALRNETNYNLLIFAMRRQPEVLTSLLKALTGLSPELQKKLWIEEDMWSADNILMMAAEYQPVAVAIILEALEKLPESIRDEVQRAVWTQRNKLGYNSLIIAACCRSVALMPLVAALQKCSLEIQEAVWTQKSAWNHNILLISARRQPAVIETLFGALLKLPEATQKKIWAQNSFYELNVVIFALMNSQLSAQKELWAVKSQEGYSVLMFALQYEPMAVAPLLNLLAQLPLEIQKSIWNAENREGNNVWMLAAHFQPMLVPTLLEKLGAFSLSVQEYILKKIPFFISIRKKLKDYLQLFLNKARAALNDSDPIERTIKKCLSWMFLGARVKQIAVLDALAELKKGSVNANEELERKRAALQNSSSPLYKALNMRRHGPSFFYKESSSLRKVKEASAAVGPIFCGVPLSAGS